MLTDTKIVVTIFDRICLDLPMVVLVDGNVHASVNGYFNAFEIEIRYEDLSSVQYFNLLGMKCSLFYLKTHFVPHIKHLPSWLQTPIIGQNLLL